METLFAFVSLIRTNLLIDCQRILKSGLGVLCETISAFQMRCTSVAETYPSIRIANPTTKYEVRGARRYTATQNGHHDCAASPRARYWPL